MAYVFSDENGNIGTIVVLKGHPNDYLPETHTYHGELEIPEDAIHEALVHNDGVIEHDEDKLKAYKIKLVEESYEHCRALFREELHDAILDGASEEELQVIRDKAVKLKVDRDAAINEINGVIEIEEITNINTDLSTGF